MNYIDIDQAIAADGLRIVLVRGFPSPWGQAAKAMIEYKGLDYQAAPQVAGGDNPELVAWAGTNSGPVVAWNDEPPLNRWDDILMLLERLAPGHPLLPSAAGPRAQVLGLSHLICGEGGLGWNCRLNMFRPVMESAEPPQGFAAMARKWRYSSSEAQAASSRCVAILEHLAQVLAAQQAAGRDCFVGDGPTAVDFYWTAFSNLVDLMSPDLVPLDDAVRPMFEQVPEAVAAAVASVLVEHRERFMRAHFRVPMEL